MSYYGFCGLSLFVLLMMSVGTVMSLEQYTPDQADWSTFQTKPFESGTNTGHDPDGVGWISADDWASCEWDGTVYNPSQMTHSEFCDAICPSVDRIRGIREVFYDHNPFADVQNPTKAEVDDWHRIALNHVRSLIGYESEDRKAVKDICMFARALWGDERKFTTMWDSEYPGDVGSAYGPCQGSGNAHCGATFIPSDEDQEPYLPDGHSPCTTQAGSEGVFSGPKSNIPWSIKWSRALCNTLLSEGFWGGHVGPFFHRQKFGYSFWDDDPSNNNNNAITRAKWTGSLMHSLYCDPSDETCDPEDTGPCSSLDEDGVECAAQRSDESSKTGDQVSGVSGASGVEGFLVTFGVASSVVFVAIVACVSCVFFVGIVGLLGIGVILVSVLCVVVGYNSVFVKGASSSATATEVKKENNVGKEMEEKKV